MFQWTYLWISLWAHLQTAPLSLKHRIASSRSAYTCDRYNNGSLKDVFVTYEYIILQGKKGFANMVKVKDLQKVRLFWITRGLNLIIWVLEIRRGRIECHRLPPDNNSTSCSWFWRWRKETISQGVDDLEGGKKARKIDAPLDLPERKAALWTDTLISAQWNPWETSDLQNCKLTNLHCIKFVAICFDSNRKWIQHIKFIVAKFPSKFPLQSGYSVL